MNDLTPHDTPAVGSPPPSRTSIDPQTVPTELSPWTRAAAILAVASLPAIVIAFAWGLLPFVVLFCVHRANADLRRTPDPRGRALVRLARAIALGEIVLMAVVALLVLLLLLMWQVPIR